MDNDCNWFNPYNIEHLKAYEHLSNTGTWPEEFYDSCVPRDIPLSWALIIAGRMASALVDLAKNDQIIGMPLYGSEINNG